MGFTYFPGGESTFHTSREGQISSAQPERRAGDAIRLNNLGVAYMNQQRLEQALKLFQQAQEMNPEFLTARLNEGIALLNLQRYEAARKLLIEITQRDPKNARGWYNLGLFHKNLGQAEPALVAFRRVAELAPNDADTYYFLGSLHSQVEQYERAIAAFERALALAPFHASAEFGLARAYQRLGDQARAREHLSRFQRLTQERLGVPVGLAYGAQGPYSLAEQVVPEAGTVAPAIPVRFVPVAGEAGLKFHHGEIFLPPRGSPGGSGTKSRPSLFGSGACFLDYDSDGRQDVFLVNSGEKVASAVFRNEGKGRFMERTQLARLEVRGYGIGCAAGDYDNDGWIDLAVSFIGRVGLFRNQGDGSFQDVTETAAIRADGISLGITFLDYDHDGDLDLYVSRFLELPLAKAEAEFEFPFEVSPATNLLWRNNGNGTFTNWTEPSGLGGLGLSVGASATDFNNDRAVDLVVTGWRKTPAVFLNPREGRFQALEPWTAPMPAATAGVVVFDFNKDGWTDLAFTHWASPGVSLWRNLEGKRAEPVALPPFEWTRGWGLAALDYDNDGWLDLVAVGETSGGAEIRLMRNRGPEGWQDVSAEVGLVAVELHQPRALITADYDGDGDTDLLVTQNAGPVELLRNDGGNQNAWLRVALKGLADNKSAIGTKVEIFAGTLWQKWEVQASSGYLGQSALEVVAGLGQEREADIVRLLWPTGVLQDETQLAARGSHAVGEIDRRGSSCPLLFVWNGSRYEFITDVIGAGIVGHWVGPGQRNISDPTEYVKVEGSRVRLAGDRLSFRFLEPMEEVVYLDQVRLLAVDHPGDVRVYPLEYFSSRPPFPSFKVIASRKVRPPRGAWDDSSRNVLAELRRRDRRYVTGFKLLPFKGFADLHTLELDLDKWNSAHPLRLLLHGFIDYFSATSVFAAHQAGVRPVPPYVEALDAEGRWVRVVDDMGFPAGLARTMVADLTGRLPAGTRRIRIVTNLQIYWDQILIDTTPEGVPMRLTEVPLADARLAFFGYPRAVEGKPRGDLTYIYEDTSQTGPYVRHVGSYTRYGDVRALLTEPDDRFVIFGTGDEVALEFDPSRLPPLPAGWTRDYFFYADGFEKDMDFYEAHSQTVEPLPFHTMPGYPYRETDPYPADEHYMSYRLNYNTRHEPASAVAALRFEYETKRK